MKKPFYILGMPLAGKSQLVNNLAKKLGIDTADTDQLILASYNQWNTKLHSVAEVFEHIGEESFRIMERIVLRSLDKNIELVSCGGGTPCFFDNIEFMNQNGTTIYLKTETEVLWEREKNSNHNIYKGLHQKDLNSLLAKRSLFYNKAHYTFNFSEALTFLSKSFQSV